MIPSFKPGIMSSNSIRKAAAGDVTPNAIDFCNLVFSGELGAGYAHSQLITGISTPITLRVSYTALNWVLYYKISSTRDYYCESFFGDPIAEGWTLLPNNATFSVSNNDYLSFLNVINGPGGAAELVTLVNTSDGDTTLDTFNLGPEV